MMSFLAPRPSIDLTLSNNCSTALPGASLHNAALQGFGPTAVAGAALAGCRSGGEHSTAAGNMQQYRRGAARELPLVLHVACGRGGQQQRPGVRHAQQHLRQPGCHSLRECGAKGLGLGRPHLCRAAVLWASCPTWPTLPLALPLSQKKRLGRGIGSGLGKTAGRGHKGQKARTGAAAGAGARRGHAGGGSSLQRGCCHLCAGRASVHRPPEWKVQCAMRHARKSGE